MINHENVHFNYEGHWKYKDKVYASPMEIFGADWDNLTPEWRRYYGECIGHIQYMLAKKETMTEAQWEMAFSCDAPNKPGYYRANND